MTTPAEVKFELQARLLALAQGGRVPVITGVHSICCEGDTAHVNYDVGNELLIFEFERPTVVGHAELLDFVRWLAWSDSNETMH